MKRAIFKRVNSTLLFLAVVFGLGISSFAQSLNPLETQPSDFGEIQRNIDPQKESIHSNKNEPQKPVLSEMEAFVAQAKQSAIENREAKSGEPQ